MPKKQKKIIAEQMKIIDEAVCEIARAVKIQSADMETAELAAVATYWGLSERMMRHVLKGDWVSTIGSMNTLYEFMQGFSQYVDKMAKATGQLNPTVEVVEGGEFGVAVMEAMPDGTVRQVDLDSLPAEDQEALREQIEAMKKEAAAQGGDTVVVGRGTGGYL